MSDLPSPERRAELRQWAEHRLTLTYMDDQGNRSITAPELLALLDAAEPVADAEVVRLVNDLRVRARGPATDYTHAVMLDAVALIERLTRELVEARRRLK